MAEITYHGYYRYTDIIFEWPKHLPDDQLQPLRAFLNAEALTDVDCPLRLPGADGLELFIGEWPNGHKRFLLSSKQLEFIRYYLYQSGMVDVLISLPSFAYLIHADEMKAVEPIILRDQLSLRRVLRDLDKSNKRIKKGTPESRMTDVQRELEEIRGRWDTAKKGGGGVFLAVDFESWEMDHSIVTEWGYAGVRWVPMKDGSGGVEEMREEGHLIAEDYKRYRNGKYVPNNTDYYRFGTSERIRTLPLFRSALKDLVEKWSSFSSEEGGGPLYLIFHDTTSDLSYLSLSSIDISTMQINLLSPSHLPSPPKPSEGPAKKVFALDTKGMYESVIKTAGTKTEKRSLETMVADLGFEEAEKFHNAGNDAHWTLSAFVKMVEVGKGGKVVLTFTE
ncbi:hypothetical protein BDY24DRAFT_377438 [Mrakia frigida]|uniref:uncharacterized protein n=1 Tax=Mrakia frigida TaxID=29902 RepID=UPI003FCC009F